MIPEGSPNLKIKGWVIFKNSFRYKSLTRFKKDNEKHLITKTSPLAWRKGHQHFGWEVEQVEYELVDAETPFLERK